MSGFLNDPNFRTVDAVEDPEHGDRAYGACEKCQDEREVVFVWNPGYGFGDWLCDPCADGQEVSDDDDEI